ncbi:disease resistance protein RUN1-like isoform X2 [Macadamia integrifolia]|uniref:disease resistance protein RUN1-like isoform X2 n=1 Tax=Macadamia integrifolia TaxID=60698 RepID=UPI001C53407B|nr:disease resistance protein RUN1-like isoform X2 [Macadamia integrifolia]
MAAEMTYIPSSSSSQWKYDVFLSFRGLDTRINFIDFLFNKLVHYGIRTFRDGEELINISSELMEAIEGSRVAIIVFSENYASSPWCLTELTKILDCKKDGRMEKVLPIFYNVDPSDVRKQTNKYAKAFKRHEEHFKDEMGKVEKWRIALTEAANLSGWDLTNVPNRHEAKFVNKIAEQVLRIVNKTHLHVADHPIGIDFHIKQIGCLLNGIRLDNVGIIGIYGPGGIGMHDLIRDMGREIVRTESPLRPGGRSRLWDNDDTIDVLGNFTGTDAVEGIQLDSCQYNGKKFSLSTVEGFSQMPNLRLLEVNSYKNGGNFDEAHSLQSWVRCFQNLVWISWEGFPFEYIPDNFDLGNIVIVNMQGSKLKEVWKGTKYLTKLKELNLSFSLYLAHMPDFSGFPNLEKLILKGCEKLVEVHESIDHLKKLVILNLKHCSNLRNLPSDISKLALLETLDISFCQRLELLPMLPSSLCSFKAQGCSRLKMLPNLSNLKHLTILLLSNCSQLTEIQGLEDLKSATNIDLLGCDNLKSSFKERIFQDLCKDLGNRNNICDIILDENEIPDWFGFQRQSDSQDNADSLSCQLTTFGTGGMIICVCLDISMETGYLGAILETVVVINKTKNFTWRHEIKFQYYLTQTWVIMIPHCVWKSIAEEGDNINVSVEETSGKFVLKKIGVHSSYALSMAAEMTYGASSSSRTWTYDVFLSFCGQDTRTIFIDFLFNELIRNRIHPFRDSEEVNRGENVSSKLIEAINGSRIAIIVFSENYASSTWCLRELVTILDCKKDGRIEKVLPVFYKVDLSDVRKQTNTYAEAFMRHEKRFKYEMGKVKSWRAALAEAASMPGLYFEKVPTGDHSILVKLIVQEVLKEVSISPLDECYDDKVFAKLKISYDKLSDDSKTIFLDIACHFTGWMVEEAIPIWEACELRPRLAIKELTQKHLLKIENDVSFRMHGQLQYMGKRIASKNSYGDPTNHTRLWSRDEISKILKKDTRFRKLKVLILTSSQDLSISPNFFSWFPCLQRLDLMSCSSLLELPDSICEIVSLKSLILSSCVSFNKLPMSIGDLKHLVKLYVNRTDIEELPEGLGQLEKLEELDVSNCPKLVRLPTSMVRMRSLLHFDMSDTMIVKVPDDFSKLSSLEVLRMGMVKPNDELDYKRLQPLLISISGFPSQLQELYLEGYNNLESLPELPSALTHLEVKKCISLQIISDLSHLERLKELLLYDCESLVRLPDLSNLKR